MFSKERYRSDISLNIVRERAKSINELPIIGICGFIFVKINRNEKSMRRTLDSFRKRNSFFTDNMMILLH